MRHVPADYLRAVYEAILRQCGASTEEARQYAQCFLNADLHGKDTQGIALVPLVYPRIRRGAIRFGAPIKVVEEGPAFAVIDGGYGPGPVVATKAMGIAIEKARAATLGAVWIRNTNTYTMAADYPMLALEHDFFGFAACNGVPLVAPWGGRDAVFNTSPTAFAVPAGREKPIIFDGAMSAESHGHVVLAARDGRRLAGLSLVEPSGHMTDDPTPIIVDPYDRNSEQLGAIFDLHSAGSSIDHWPSCKIRLMGDEAKDAMQLDFLKLFGTPLGIVGDRVHETTLSGEAVPNGIVYLSTEFDGAGRITPWIRDLGDKGLKRCLKRMGILPDAYAVDPPERETRLMAMQTGDNYIFASADGLFEPRVELGDEVEDGHFAGYIWSVREPWRPPVELWFNRGGVVFCKRHPALCEIGDTLFFALNDYQG